MYLASQSVDWKYPEQMVEYRLQKFRASRISFPNSSPYSGRAARAATHSTQAARTSESAHPLSVRASSSGGNVSMSAFVVAREVLSS